MSTNDNMSLWVVEWGRLYAYEECTVFLFGFIFSVVFAGYTLVQIEEMVLPIPIMVARVVGMLIFHWRRLVW